MNALLLGGACLGALAVFLTTDPKDVAAAKAEMQLGSMTHELSTDPITGETEETSVIAFLDP
jgi:hypothetical protein